MHFITTRWKRCGWLFTYTQFNKCLCVRLVFFCSAFLFLWHIASVAVAMWGTNMKQCLTHTAHSDISWRKWGFYWQRCEVHIISIELQASVSSSLPNEFMELWCLPIVCRDYQVFLRLDQRALLVWRDIHSVCFDKAFPGSSLKLILQVLLYVYSCFLDHKGKNDGNSQSG